MTAANVAKPDWTEPEKWAWERIASGNVADFATQYGDLDPRWRRRWDASRRLRADFLRAILFDRALADQVPSAGVRITGALWEEAIDLSHADVKWPLCLERCRFEKPVNLGGLRMEGRLVLRKAAFLGGGGEQSLNLEGASIRRADLSEATFAKAVAARTATFEGAFDLSGAALRGTFDFGKGKAASVALRDGGAAQLNLSNCRVDQDLDLAGARVRGAVKLGDIRVGGHLRLGGSGSRASRFQAEISLVGGSIGGNANFCGIEALGPINMNSFEVKGNLFLRMPFAKDDEPECGRTRFAAGIDLSFAVVHGHIELWGSRFGGPVNLNTAQIGGNLHGFGERWQRTVYRQGLALAYAWVKGEVNLSFADFGTAADFSGARIDGSLYLTACLCRSDLLLTDVRIGRNLYFTDYQGVRAICRGEVRLQYATVDGQLVLTGLFHGDVVASGLKVGINLILANVSDGRRLSTAAFRSRAMFGLVTVGDELSLVGARFGSQLNLSGSQTGGQLALDLPRKPAAGKKAIALDLRDAKAGSFQVVDDGRGWPDRGSVQLDGFVYDRLDGTNPDAAQEMMARPVEWLTRWLELDEPYSPQPYEQLAAVLRRAGEVERPNRILHAARERARKAAWTWRRPFRRGFFRAAGLFLLKVTIGYGIGLRFFYALLWAAALTAVGVGVLVRYPPLADGAPLVGLGDRIAYSFDQLLPIIELSKTFGEVKLPREAEQYFYVLRIFGFLLGAFITAGVAGLTQRARS